MISLTRINHATLVLNSDLIEQIQATPDTVITLTNGRNYMVLETPDEVVSRVMDFRRRLSEQTFRCAAMTESGHQPGLETRHGI